MSWDTVWGILLIICASYGLYHLGIDIAASVMTRARRETNKTQMKCLQNILDGKIREIGMPGFHPAAPGSCVMFPDDIADPHPRPPCYKSTCPQNIADECIRACGTACTWKEPA